MKIIASLGDFKLTEKSLSGEFSKTIGIEKVNFPLKQISSVRFERSRGIIGLMIYEALALLCFYIGADTVVFAGLGILFSINAFLSFVGHTGIRIRTSGNDDVFVTFRGESKEDIIEFSEIINETITKYA